jgi:hypothetical protein
VRRPLYASIAASSDTLVAYVYCLMIVVLLLLHALLSNRECGDGYSCHAIGNPDLASQIDLLRRYTLPYNHFVLPHLHSLVQNMHQCTQPDANRLTCFCTLTTLMIEWMFYALALHVCAAVYT